MAMVPTDWIFTSASISVEGMKNHRELGDETARISFGNRGRTMERSGRWSFFHRVADPSYLFHVGLYDPLHRFGLHG